MLHNKSHASAGVSSLGVPGAMAPPDFGRSVNPISTRGGRLCPPNNTGILRFSDLPTALYCWCAALNLRAPFSFLFSLLIIETCVHITMIFDFQENYPNILKDFQLMFVKFRYSEKATKIWKNLPVYLTLRSKKFVTILEYFYFCKTSANTCTDKLHANMVSFVQGKFWNFWILYFLK